MKNSDTPRGRPPRLSVIIPTHSRPNLLPFAVESARAAGSDVEIIVVDDASEDETADVCRGLAGIRYVRVERNLGVAGARNVGLLASRGEYVAFLDDDDRRLPGSLDLQADALEAGPEAGFACGGMVMVGQDYSETGEVIYPRHGGGDAFWELLELDFPVMPLSTLIRRDCFLRVGLLNTRLGGIDDWDIFVRIAELYPVLVNREPVGLYRLPTPSSGQGSSSQSAQLLRAARHQLQLLQLPRAAAAPASLRRAVRRRTLDRVADTLLHSAVQHAVGGRWGTVWADVLAASRLSPFRMARPTAYRKLWGALRAGRPRGVAPGA